MKKGYNNAAALLGGTNAWKTAGFPMETSDKKPEEKKP
jgi:rhodanese-related sulfurtransferase